MNVLLFHLMPWAELDPEGARRFPNAWSPPPDRFCDSKKGHALYDRHLGELEYGEEACLRQASCRFRPC